MTTLSRIITKGLIKTGRIADITTKVEDKPGSLLQLLKVVADSGANILSISHAREDPHSDVGACMVSMVLETRNGAHVDQIRRELTAWAMRWNRDAPSHRGHRRHPRCVPQMPAFLRRGGAVPVRVRVCRRPHGAGPHTELFL